MNRYTCTTNITSSASHSHLTCRWGTSSQIPACKPPVKSARPPTRRQCGRASRKAARMSVVAPWTIVYAKVALHQ